MLELGENALEEHIELLSFALSLEIETIGVCGSLFAQAAQNLLSSSEEYVQRLIFAQNSKNLEKNTAYPQKMETSSCSKEVEVSEWNAYSLYWSNNE